MKTITVYICEGCQSEQNNRLLVSICAYCHDREICLTCSYRCDDCSSRVCDTCIMIDNEQEFDEWGNKLKDDLCKDCYDERGRFWGNASI